MSAAVESSSNFESLAFCDAGGEARPVLFVHGYSHNRAVWEGIVAGLGSRYRPIAVDLRGHGDSPWSIDGQYGLDDYAGDLALFLDQHDLSDIHVVGHSLGGNVATLACAMRRGRVRSLCLVDTGPSLRAEATGHIVGEVGEALRPYKTIRAYRSVLAMMHPFAAGSLLDTLATRSLVRRRDGQFELALDPAVLGGSGGDFDLEAMEESLWTALREIGCPIFIARGGRSSVLENAVAVRMHAEAKSGSRFETFEEAGHAVMIDSAAALSERLHDFLLSIDGD